MIEFGERSGDLYVGEEISMAMREDVLRCGRGEKFRSLNDGQRKRD
jgi:hypothetical protein